MTLSVSRACILQRLSQRVAHTSDSCMVLCGKRPQAKPLQARRGKVADNCFKGGPYYDALCLVNAKVVLHTVRAQTAEATAIGTRVAKPKAGTVTRDPGIAPQTEKCKADAGRKLNTTAQSTPHIKHRPCLEPPAWTTGRPS